MRKLRFSGGQKLTAPAKQRYEEKLWIVSCLDPFLLPTVKGRRLASAAELPPVEASDIVSYLFV